MRINKKIIADLATFIDMRYDISIADYQEKYPELYKNFLRMQYWMDELILERYFSNNDNADEEGNFWVDLSKWDTRKTGQQLLDKINENQDMSPDIPLKILDVGCGDNKWKKHFGASLTGIDPYNSNADHKIGINEYYELQKSELGLEQFDIILVLGSINFGDKIEIERQISDVTQLLKPGGKIFWRCNPGITHDSPNAKWIDFFEWSEEYIKDIAKRCKCTVEEVCWDHPEDDKEIRWGNRLYSEWTKNSGFNS